MVSRVVVLCFSFLLILSWNFKHNSWWVLLVGIFLSGSFLHSCFWLCISDALIFICISSNLLKFVWKIPDCIGFLPPVFTVLFWAAFEGFSANLICFFWCFGLGKKLLYFSSKLCDLWNLNQRGGTRNPNFGQSCLIPIGKVLFWLLPQVHKCVKFQQIFFFYF